MPGGRCLTLLEPVQFSGQASIEIGARATTVIALLLLVLALVRRFLQPGLAAVFGLGLILLGAQATALPMNQLLKALALAAEGRLPRNLSWHEFLPLAILLAWQGTIALIGRAAPSRETRP